MTQPGETRGAKKDEFDLDCRYWRSSASYRARTALTLTACADETCPIYLRLMEQTDAELLRINPGGTMSVLVHEDGTGLCQSLAILDWLDLVHAVPPLLPANRTLAARARARA